MSVTIVRQNGEDFTVDAVVRESHRRALRVTDHPVEDGSTTSDHIQKLPSEIVLTGFMTESPLEGRENGLPAGSARTLETIRFFESIEGEIVDIVTTRLGTFTDMAMTNWPHDVDVTLKLPLTLTFRKFRIATTELVVIPPDGTSSTGAPDEQDVGVQGTKDTADNPQKEADDRSVAASLFDYFAS